jgi:hypothetical protein
MLNLLDILRAKSVTPENYKIHLASGTNPTPLEAFLGGHFQHWQDTQNNKNFQCDNIVSLIGLGADRWLFAGVYKVLGVEKGVDSPYLYRTELLPNQDDLIGRTVVRYKKEHRASYVWGHRYAKHLDVAEIMPRRISIGDFPGYNAVRISDRTLKLIVSHEEPSWKAALSNVKGVYLISDTSTGRLYVGIATAEGSLWQRWECYAATGHGGNVELKILLTQHGSDYADNFQYAILEIADSHATTEFIESRECYWKDVLLSRKFGYNKN